MSEISRELKVYKDAAVSILNDLRYCLLRTDGDVELLLVRENGKPAIHKFIHSSILIARSKWFAEKYEKYRKSNDFNDFHGAFGQLEVIAKVNEKANTKLTLHMKGITVQALQDFVKYLYCFQRNINESNVTQLLSLAHIFDVSTLKIQISSFLISILKEKTDIKYTIELYKMANKSGLEDLEKYCIEIINREKHLVVQTKTWKALDAELVAKAFKV